MKSVFVTLISFFGSIFLFQSSTLFAAEEDLVPVLQVYGAPEPGIVYIDDDGNLAGVAGEKVQAFLDNTGIAYEIRLIPFVRAYQETLSRDDAIIINMARTPLRDNLFNWVFPMGEFSKHLIALNTPEFTNITKEQILAGQYRALCERGALDCLSLQNFGFSAESIITLRETSFDDLARLLLRGRAEFIVGDLDRLNLDSSNDGLNRSRFINVMEIEGGRAWIAAGQNINPHILERLLAAAEEEE